MSIVSLSTIPLWTKLLAWGHSVDLHILDNEISMEFKQVITEDCQSKYQLVSLNIRCRNQAEQAIQSTKDHFLVIFAGLDPKFPRSM